MQANALELYLFCIISVSLVIFNSLASVAVIWWQNWVSIGSGNGLVFNSTKPLPELMKISDRRFCGNDLRSVSLKELKITIYKMWLEITHSTLQPHIPVVNELNDPKELPL